MIEICDKYKKKEIITEHTNILQEINKLRQYSKDLKKLHKNLLKSFNLFSELISEVSETPVLNSALDINEIKEVEEIYEMIMNDEDSDEYESTSPIYIGKEVFFSEGYDPLDVEIKLTESENVLNKELNIEEDIEFLDLTEEEKENKTDEEFDEEFGFENFNIQRKVECIDTPINTDLMEGCVDTTDYLKRENMIKQDIIIKKDMNETELLYNLFYDKIDNLDEVIKILEPVVDNDFIEKIKEYKNKYWKNIDELDNIFIDGIKDGIKEDLKLKQEFIEQNKDKFNFVVYGESRKNT